MQTIGVGRKALFAGASLATVWAILRPLLEWVGYIQSVQLLISSQVKLMVGERLPIRPGSPA